MNHAGRSSPSWPKNDGATLAGFGASGIHRLFQKIDSTKRMRGTPRARARQNSGAPLRRSIMFAQLENAPSQTGNPSGGGRGNNPPSK